MTLGGAIEGYLGFLRSEAESTQTETCTITRPGAGEETFDAETGISSPPAGTTVYAGDGRFRAPTVNDQRVMAGEHGWTTQDAVFAIPVDATDVQVGDLVTITASSVDPGLVDTAHVVMAIGGGQVTARRLLVRRVTS